MENNEASWVAGLLSVFGQVAVCKVFRVEEYGQTLYIRLTIRSRTRAEAVKEFGRIVGVPAKQVKATGSMVWSVVISGDGLHEVMLRIWPELSKERKQEYKKARVLTLASKIDYGNTTGGSTGGSTEG